MNVCERQPGAERGARPRLAARGRHPPSHKAWAHAMRDRVDGYFREADRMVVVLDTLHTNVPGALDTLDPAPAAFRIVRSWGSMTPPSMTRS